MGIEQIVAGDVKKIKETTYIEYINSQTLVPIVDLIYMVGVFQKSTELRADASTDEYLIKLAYVALSDKRLTPAQVGYVASQATWASFEKPAEVDRLRATFIKQIGAYDDFKRDLRKKDKTVFDEWGGFYDPEVYAPKQS